MEISYIKCLWYFGKK